MTCNFRGINSECVQKFLWLRLPSASVCNKKPKISGKMVEIEHSLDHNGDEYAGTKDNPIEVVCILSK